MTGYPDYFATHDLRGLFRNRRLRTVLPEVSGRATTFVVALHGGPGMPHDYLAPLVQHAGEDLTVYLYDQFGVGHSDKPAPGTSTATRSSYRDELEAVRREIDPGGSFTIYGQSWGGMLAQEYVMLEYGDHVDALILANTLADTQTAYYESMRSVLDELSDEDRATVEEYESQRAYDAPEYEAARRCLPRAPVPHGRVPPPSPLDARTNQPRRLRPHVGAQRVHPHGHGTSPRLGRPQPDRRHRHPRRSSSGEYDGSNRR